MSKRYSDLQSHLKDKGSLAGRPPWGFIVVGDKYGKTLVPDPAKVKYLKGMVSRALRGDTYSSIARWLELEGVETVHGKKWMQNTVSGILSSSSLNGRRIDAAGKVELKHEGIMSSAEWDELQAALDARPGRRGKITAETALLTGIIFCDRCHSPMYRHQAQGRHETRSVRDVSLHGDEPRTKPVPKHGGLGGHRSLGGSVVHGTRPLRQN